LRFFLFLSFRTKSADRKVYGGVQKLHFCKNTIFALRNLAFLQKYNFCTPELAKIHSRYKYLSANILNKSNLFYSDFNRLTVSDCSSYFATVPNSGVQKFQIVPECKNCICIALRIQLELDIC